MASESMTTIYLIDTSYILELFEVPGSSSNKHSQEIRHRFQSAIGQDALFFVPLPCLFEVGNHIAKVPDGRKRSVLAAKLRKTVLTSIEDSMPWTITPSCTEDELKSLLVLFERQCVGARVGLTDAMTIYEAKRLKKKYGSLLYRVHIWTKDRQLKTYEPDSEHNAFTG